jgi:predicted negative regulator of RcsB-dependent stress response
LEMRFLLVGILLVTLFLTSWVWMQKKDRESYVSQSMQKIETAAGSAKSRN